MMTPAETEPISVPSEAEMIQDIVRPETHPTAKSARAAARLVMDVATAAAQIITPPLRPPITTASTTPPMTDTERITSLESRVRELETTTTTLSSQFLTLSQQFIIQGESYKLLLQTNKTLIDDAAANKREIECLDSLVAELRKDKPSQGGVVILDESCRSDELAKKTHEDTDNDPSASKDVELAGPSKAGQQTMIQGESAGDGASGSGAGTGTDTVATEGEAGEILA